MKTITITIAVLTLSAAGVGASAEDMEELTRPAETDYTEVAQKIAPILGKLELGEAGPVIDEAFPESSPLYQNVQGQIPNLKSQLKLILDLYGPATECERARRGHNGSLVVKMEYLCQHERFVTQWNFTMMNTSNGWTLGAINFADAK